MQINRKEILKNLFKCTFVTNFLITIQKIDIPKEFNYNQSS